MLEEDTMHIGTEADVSAHVLDIIGAAGTRQNTNNSPKSRGTQPVDELPCGGEPR